MDEALLEGFRAGRRDALERVYWEQIDGIETLVRATLRRSQQFSPANVADLVQDIFAKAFSAKARVGYDGVREYSPFLRQIARNTLVDWLRQRGKEAFVEIDPEAVSQAEHASAEADAGVAPELLNTVRHFVNGLEPELKGVHERRFLAAESQERAAEVLGISRQTLRTLERRLLDGLRREIRRFEQGQRAMTFSQPDPRAKPY